MSIEIKIFFLNSSYFLKAICSLGNSFLKLPSSLIMIHPFSIHGQKLTGHFILLLSLFQSLSLLTLNLIVLNWSETLLILCQLTSTHNRNWCSLCDSSLRTTITECITQFFIPTKKTKQRCSQMILILMILKIHC